MSRPLPLDGVTVVDLGQIYNGPYCSFLLAMAGARVIKIESPGGEHLRRRSVVGGAAVPFAMLNSNKNFVTLNLKTARGRELLMEMVRRGDVVVENFAPGAMERLGVGYEQMCAVNPRIVYCSVSAFGQGGALQRVLLLGDRLAAIKLFGAAAEYVNDAVNYGFGHLTLLNARD